MQYPDDVPDELKRERLEELIEVQRAISGERLARFVGREVDVLVDRVADPLDGGATHVGRVQWQADGVDGVTALANGGGGGGRGAPPAPPPGGAGAGLARGAAPRA